MCRGKTGRLPTPAQLHTASPAALLSMLKQHQAGHANFALEGLRCFMAYMRKDITNLDADHLAGVNESVGEIVCSHPQHTPIQQIGTALRAAYARGHFNPSNREAVAKARREVEAEETAALNGKMQDLSITQLKNLIVSRGASYADCVERSDLEARARKACQPDTE